MDRGPAMRQRPLVGSLATICSGILSQAIGFSERSMKNRAEAREELLSEIGFGGSNPAACLRGRGPTSAHPVRQMTKIRDCRSSRPLR